MVNHNALKEMAYLVAIGEADGNLVADGLGLQGDDLLFFVEATMEEVAKLKPFPALLSLN